MTRGRHLKGTQTEAVGSAKQVVAQECEAYGQEALFGGTLECRGKGRERIFIGVI